MADGALLPDLLLCCPFYQENYGSTMIAFLSTKTTTDSNREHLENKQEQSKKNELNKTNEDLGGFGERWEDYPSKTCIME
jgi:hypothetical protein